MLLHYGPFTGWYPLITINKCWMCMSLKAGGDRKLTWKKQWKSKNLVCKLNLLQKSSFLGRKSLLYPIFYILRWFSLVWPKVYNYLGPKLTSWTTLNLWRWLAFNLPWDTSSEEVMDLTHWASIYHVHELYLVLNTAHDIAPSVISSKDVWHNSLHNLRGHKNAILQFSTYLFK